MSALRFIVLAVSVWLTATVSSWAQPASAPPVVTPTTGVSVDASPLGVRQQRVTRMMGELERRFLALAKSLEQSEPERSAKLVKAFEESKSLLVEQRMSQIASLLDKAKLDNAGQEQQQVLEDVRKLIAILINESADRQEEKEEIERLKKWHKEISQLLQDEQQQRKESQKLDKKDAALEQLAQQLESVKELIRREEELVRKTALARAEGLGLTPLADRQQLIRNDTEFVSKDMTKAQAALAQSENSDSKSPNGLADSQPGQRPLAQAAQHQQAAEQKLQDGQGKSAQQSEEQALAELKKALDELQQEQQRLQKPPEDTFDKLAQKQQATAGKSGALSNQVAKAGQACKPGSPSSASCSACQSSLSKAGQKMDEAIAELKKRTPAAASKEQKQAEEELKKAQEEVEKRLKELGEKLDDETLVRLEDLFNQMLSRQQQATLQTTQVDADRKADKDAELRRADRITLKRLSQEELELGLLAVQALELIEKDGTSISFPVVVANLRDNLRQVAEMLEGHATGDGTQTLQREIEKTLEELIEALQIAKKSKPGGSGEGGGKCKPALLPNTAELKLLRALQLRVNRRTKAFDQVRPEGDLDKARHKEISRISELQKEIGGMVQAIIERTQAAKAK